MTFYATAHFILTDILQALALVVRRVHLYASILGEAGTLQELVKRVLNKNEFEAMRFISSKEAESLENFDEMLSEAMEDKPVFKEFSEDIL